MGWGLKQRLAPYQSGEKLPDTIPQDTEVEVWEEHRPWAETDLAPCSSAV